MEETRTVKEIKERIQEAGSPDTAISLDLDNIRIRSFSKEIKALIEKLKKVEYISMNGCELKTLKNFPILPALSILELSDNLYFFSVMRRIEDDELYHLLKNSQLSHLMLDSNRLKSIEKVSVLRQLPNLEHIELVDNFIGEPYFYRDELFERIPQIKIIDCHDRQGSIAIDSDSDDSDVNKSIFKQSEYEEEVEPSESEKVEKAAITLLGNENMFKFFNDEAGFDDDTDEK